MDKNWRDFAEMYKNSLFVHTNSEITAENVCFFLFYIISLQQNRCLTS